MAQLAESEPSAEALLPWLLVALLMGGFALFVVHALAGYRQRFAEAGTGFAAGSTRLVELTVIREDMDNLACASDAVVGGLRCGYDDQRRLVPALDEARTLRPYYTVTGEMLLGAGLWSSKALPAPLPAQRFTVSCNYRVVSVLKSAALRWAPKGAFDPLQNSVVVGALEGCEIPR